jgi:hypothetical protein
MSNPFKVGDKIKLVGPGHSMYEMLTRNACYWGLSFDSVYLVKEKTPDTVTLDDVTPDAVWSYHYFERSPDVVETPAVKPSNPKDVIGSTRPPLHNVPCGPLYQIGAAMLSGACKYGSHNWRSIGVRSDVYYDAMQRHIMSWWEGETLDPESGAPHLAHVAACCIILLDAEAAGKLTDNRPPVVGNPSQAVQELVTSILQKYPNPVEPFTEKNAWLNAGDGRQ